MKKISLIILLSIITLTAFGQIQDLNTMKVITFDDIESRDIEELKAYVEKVETPEYQTVYNQYMTLYDQVLSLPPAALLLQLELLMTTRKRLDNLIWGNIMWNLPRGNKFSRRVRLDGDQFGEVDYSIYDVGVDGENGHVFNIYYEGTSGEIDFQKGISGDWSANFKRDIISYHSLSGTLDIHGGMCSYFEAAKNELLNQFHQSSLKSQSDKVTINLTGYSQGGAVAILMHHFLKSISGKDGYPIIELNTAIFGAPGIVKETSKNIANLKQYLTLTRDVIQIHYSADFITYSFNLGDPHDGYPYINNYPPEGRCKLIGTPERHERSTQVGVSEITSVTPLVNKRVVTNGPEGGLKIWEDEFLTQTAYLMKGEMDKVDHMGYMRIYGPGLPYDSEPSLESIKNINFWSAAKIRNADYKDVVSTIGEINLSAGSNVRITASEKVLLKPGLTIKPGSNFTVNIHK